MKKRDTGPVRYTKATLPSKFCAACSRPFMWRKAWAKNWMNVKYCSDRCRATRPKANPPKL